jgi:hypothetical protein
MKAARRVCQGWVKPRDLPSNAEIRDEIQNIARLHEGDARSDRLCEMRLAAYRMMQILKRFRPRLIGSVLTGHIRAGSDIDLHLFSNSFESVTGELDFHGLTYETERKRIRKDGEEQIYRHVHIAGEFPFELTVYREDKHSYVFKSSITGKPIERASLNQLREFLQSEYPELDWNDDNDCGRTVPALSFAAAATGKCEAASGLSPRRGCSLPQPAGI